MTERTHNFLVGLMCLSGLVGLMVILMLFGYVPQLLEQGYLVRVELNHAGGLSHDSSVKLSGIEIGKVRTVELLQRPQRGVAITVLIKPENEIPRQARVSVEAPIIGGSPTLAFNVDRLTPGQLDDVLSDDGTALIKGRVPSLASQFADELKAALDEPFEQFIRLSAQWTTLAANLNDLVEQRDPAQVDNGEQAGNLTTVLMRTDKRLAELKSVTAGLSAWLNDEKLRSDVRATAASARLVTQKIGYGIDSISRLADDTKAGIKKLVTRYVALGDDLSKAIATLQSVAHKVDNGKGSVSRFLNDPAVYENSNDALQRMNEVIKQLQLLIEKWKKEGVPVQL